MEAPLGPVQIAGRLGMPASTVHAVLTRCRVNRLSDIDRRTGEPVRRYEHDHAGAMLHVDPYAEICDDEKAATAIDVLRRAVTWSAARGVVIERVLTDNGSAYKSYAWRDACTELGVTPKKTRPYRPQTATGGKPPVTRLTNVPGQYT
jgi:transposase